MKIPLREFNGPAWRSARGATDTKKIPFQAAVMKNPVKHPFAEIQELAPAINSRAAEIEAARRVPPDLVEALKSIGVFRIFVPQSHGGLELDLPAALQIFLALSRIDGSVGWAAMIGGGCDIFASLLAREAYEQVYQSGPDVIIAGSAQPAGTAEAGAAGSPAHRRLPVARGGQHSPWVFRLSVLTQGGKALPGPAGWAGPPPGPG